MPKFRTVQFGELQYKDGDVIHLPEGLVGMPTLQKWLILEMGDDLPLKWFQSLDREDFGFPVTQPYFFQEEYEIGLTQESRNQLENKKEEDLVVLIITTVHPGGVQVTGNLLAPLVMDTETRRGLQLTQDDSKFSVRQEINYLKFGLAVNSDSADNGSSGSVDSSKEDLVGEEPAAAEIEPAETTEPVGVS